MSDGIESVESSREEETSGDGGASSLTLVPSLPECERAHSASVGLVLGSTLADCDSMVVSKGGTRLLIALVVGAMSTIIADFFDVFDQK